MSDDLEILRTRMEAAAAALDFEEARRLRDEIERLSTGDMAASRLRRQQPGKMGLGTSDQVFVPPPGWKPPKKPDPMTRGHSGPKRRR
jgi:hypothetical protein